MKKIVRSLPKSWEPKSRLIQQAKDHKLYHFIICLVVNYHEMMLDDDTSNMKKDITFKATTVSEGELDGEEMVIVAQKF